MISRRGFLRGMGIGAVAAWVDPAVFAAGKKPGANVRDKELIDRSAVDLARLIRGKKVTAEEVVRAFLNRIEEVNPILNAVVQLRAEEALKEARKLDEALAKGNIKGPLHGIPMTVKDSFDTKDLISTAGTLGRKSFIPKNDATVVARLRDAGAIVLGKTNTPELTLFFETDNLVYGRTNNPYDLELTPGGSSGGAAAVLAVSGSPLDIGSDTGGSIRLPSHFCGITGIKPTSGRVPRTGHIISFTGAMEALTQIGPLARYVEDLALTLPVISGIDWQDPYIVPIDLKDPADVKIKKLNVAYYTDDGVSTPTPETINTVKSAANALKDAGCTVREDRPQEVRQAMDFQLKLRDYVGVAMQDLLLKNAGTEKTFFKIPKLPPPIPIEKYYAVLEEWSLIKSRMLNFLKNYDVIICPVYTHPAYPHGSTLKENFLKGFGYTFTENMTGWPVTVVRCGTSPEGLPIGVQVAARPWREDVSLAVAQYLEKTFGGWKPFSKEKLDKLKILSKDENKVKQFRWGDKEKDNDNDKN